MSESFRPTKQQNKILKLIYRKCRTFAYLSRKLHVSVDDMRELTGWEMVRYLIVDLPVASHDYSLAVVSITRDGTAYIESVMDQERNHRMEVRHFWIGVILGGVLGWMLTSLGTPKDLFLAISRFFNQNP